MIIRYDFPLTLVTTRNQDVEVTILRHRYRHFEIVTIGSPLEWQNRTNHANNKRPTWHGQTLFQCPCA